MINGFTSYVGYNTGPNTQGNYFQLDAPSGRLYQLNNSGNTNDAYRYQFYSRNTYDLSFVTNGGTPVAEVPDVRYESSLEPYEPEPPTRGDDEFLGWYTDSAFSMPFEFDGATMPASNVVLYARWLVNPHAVEFFDDPAASDPLDDLTQTVADQSQAEDPGALPARPDGSTFLGWYQRTSEGYFVPFDFATPIGSPTQLYARWQQPAGSPFTVTYDGNGNTAGTVPRDALGYDAGASAVVLDGSSLRRGDEVFVGWRLDVSEPATRLGPVEGLYQVGHTVPVGGADVRLVAVYADPSPSFTVTFDENAGDQQVVDWDAVPGARITYPGAEDLGFSGDGAPSEFLGWSTDPGAAEPDPAYDRLVVSTIDGDLVLYAVWAAGPSPTPTPSPSATPSPSVTPSVSPSPAPSPSTSPSPPGPPGPTTGPDAGLDPEGPAGGGPADGSGPGWLASTGPAALAWVAAAAAALLVVGAVLVGRRHRDG